jgi:hypothetical protein
MKTLKLTLLVIVTACLTFSCESDDDNNDSSGNFAELIIGTWKWTASSANGVAEALTECDLMDTTTFTSTTYSGVEHGSNSGNAPCSSDEYDGTYSINGNVITWDGDPEDTDEIATLNATTLVLKYVDSDDSTVYLDTYTKQ